MQRQGIYCCAAGRRNATEEFNGVWSVAAAQRASGIPHAYPAAEQWWDSLTITQGMVLCVALITHLVGVL